MKPIIHPLLYMMLVLASLSSQVVLASYTQPSIEPLDTAEIYYQVDLDDSASYQGGMMAMIVFVGNHIQYPIQAKLNNIQGRVEVKFRITKEGFIDSIQVINDTIGYGLGEAVVEVVKQMPKWNPGVKQGKKVDSWFVLPVNFKMADTIEAKPKKWWQIWK